MLFKNPAINPILTVSSTGEQKKGQEEPGVKIEASETTKEHKNTASSSKSDEGKLTN